jgi:hypothetical protein
MKSLLLSILCALPLLAQTPAAGDPVVLVVEGHSYTRAQLEGAFKSLPPEIGKSFEANRKGWVEQFAFLTHMAELGKRGGIDRQEPYRSVIEINLAQFLAQATVEAHSKAIDRSAAARQAWFESHKAEYRRARTRVILLNWSRTPDKDSATPGLARSSSDADMQLAALAKRAQAGEDFAALAKRYSEDPDAKTDGGEFPLYRPEDNALDRGLRTAVFALKPGEISKPVHVNGSSYIFQLIEFQDPKFEDLDAEISKRLGSDEVNRWIEAEKAQVKYEIKDPAFFAAPAKP